MAILTADIFVTNSARDARWLEAGLMLLLNQRRGDGLHDHPPRLFELISELHSLADPAAVASATSAATKWSGFDSLSVSETAKRLKVSGAMVRRRCDDGSLVAVKSTKGQWRIQPESVERLEAK